MKNVKIAAVTVLMFLVARAMVDAGYFPAARPVFAAVSSAAAKVSSLGRGGPTPAVAAQIRRCESGGNYRAQNAHSSASGAYQFIDGTWHGVTGLPGHARDYPAATQDRAFVKLWAGGRGAHNWDASRRCWGRYWSG